MSGPYDTAENRSSEWGTSPPHWYFTSALPRSLLAAYPLAFIGGYAERRVRALLACATFYVGAYSFLPHKELRFIFPALPLMNAAAAAAAARVWTNRGKIYLYYFGETTKVTTTKGRSSSRNRTSSSSSRRRSWWWTVVALGVAGAWALSIAAHLVFAMAARDNYPG